MKNETDEQRAEDAAKIKAIIKNQADNVDYEDKGQRVQAVFTKLDDLIGKQSVLGQSLEEQNLKGIIHKVLKASD